MPDATKYPSTKWNGVVVRGEKQQDACMKLMYVYIVANSSRTLYVGVTNNLKRRVLEHRTGKSKFTKRYGIHRLVYVERIGPPIAAFAREYQIKRYGREKRERLIRSMNPRWEDLAESWFKFPFGTPASSTPRWVTAKEVRERS